MRILGEKAISAHTRRLGLGAFGTGLGLDERDQFGAGRAMPRGREGVPAWKIGEAYFVSCGELPGGDALTSATGLVLGGPIEPGAEEVLPGGQSANA
jgi:hypothetical protein